MTSLVCFSLAAVAGLLSAMRYVFARGVRRGREMERMELPRDGEMYFADGPVWPVEAESATMALERVARMNGRAW